MQKKGTERVMERERELQTIKETREMLAYQIKKWQLHQQAESQGAASEKTDTHVDSFDGQQAAALGLCGTNR